MNDPLYASLTGWAKKHYRESLGPNDLGDPSIVDESRAALDELTQILKLGPDFYPFQRT